MANQSNQSQNPINKIIAWLGKHLLPWDDVSLVRLKKFTVQNCALEETDLVLKMIGRAICYFDDGTVINDLDGTSGELAGGYTLTSIDSSREDIY